MNREVLEQIEEECRKELYQPKAHTHEYCLMRLHAAERIIERKDAEIERVTQGYHSQQRVAIKVQEEMLDERAMRVAAEQEVARLNKLHNDSVDVLTQHGVEALRERDETIARITVERDCYKEVLVMLYGRRP